MIWRHVLSLTLLVGIVDCGSTNDTASTGATSTASVGVSAGSGTGGSLPAAPISLHPIKDARIGSNSSVRNFQHATAEIDFEGGPYASATLHVQLKSTCYPFDNWKNDPPPANQNWPADCDAFDRNFETSLYPEGDDKAIGVELVRAITPFGGPLDITEDITDVANGMPGVHQIRVEIPSYSDGAGIVSGSNGGWNVTVDVDLVPGTAPHNVLAVIPLYYDSDTSPNGPGPLAFDAPDGVTAGHVEYRATGHGGATGTAGCIGPAEEFCKRDHHISVDGAEVAVVQPWRADCAKNCTVTTYSNTSKPFQYCLENPCGDMNSVKASRANWCPGTETPPLQWDVPKAAGAHSFQWTIPKLASGGQWRISATYFAYGP
jgi:Peptide-N-glycosidase F, C terminal